MIAGVAIILGKTYILSRILGMALDSTWRQNPNQSLAVTGARWSEPAHELRQ